MVSEQRLIALDALAVPGADQYLADSECAVHLRLREDHDRQVIVHSDQLHTEPANGPRRRRVLYAVHGIIVDYAHPTAA